jgi:hypothetical protein
MALEFRFADFERPPVRLELTSSLATRDMLEGPAGRHVYSPERANTSSARPFMAAIIA